MNPSAIPNADYDEADLIRRALRRDTGALRQIMETYNRRLFRLACSIVRDPDDARDVVQETYLLAFSHLDGFRGDSTLSTWLCRITIHQALGLKRRRTHERLDEDGLAAQPSLAPDPERATAQRQFIHQVEQAILELPLPYRAVIMARAVEGLSVEETAHVLDIRPETVKTRLHRARRLLELALQEPGAPRLLDVFPFAGPRCQALTQAVLTTLGVNP